MYTINFLLFILGLAIGSFANVLIDRTPKGEDVFTFPSHCDFCKKPLRWYELIPVISWVIQGGRCRRCRHQLSVQYPLVELSTGVAFVLLYQVFSSTLPIFLSSYLIFLSLLVIFVADLKYQIIPDSMVVLGLLGSLLQGVALQSWASAVGSSLFFLLLSIITRGRGMGLGDAKLAFLLGLILGFPKIVIALYAAFLTGAGVGVILILTGKKKLKSKIAFGPFLIVGTVVAILWGEKITQSWQKFL